MHGGLLPTVWLFTDEWAAGDAGRSCLLHGGVGSDYQEQARTKQVEVDHLVDFFTSMGQRAGLPPVDTVRAHEVVVELWKVYMS